MFKVNGNAWPTSGNLNEDLKSLLNLIVDTASVDRKAFSINSPPGMGLITTLREIATERGITFREVRMTMLDQYDVTPMPFIDDSAENGISYAQPDPMKHLDLTAQEPALIVLSDFEDAAPTVKNYFKDWMPLDLNKIVIHTSN